MIVVHDLVHRYRPDASPALDGVTLQIERGSLFGLLGPNGAGKTTLISLVAGLLAAQLGRITIDGQPLADFRSTQPNAIALVPQDYAFYPMLTVAENLAFFAGVQGLARSLQTERCAAAIHFARLEGVARQLAGELSGGLRRRLNLAIGLLGDPALLLLDEPTVGVDPQSRHFLLDAIRDLGEAGKTVIYTSHYMDEVEALCDRVAIIDHGKVLVQGRLTDVLRDEAPALTLRLDRALPSTLADDWAVRYPGFAHTRDSIRLHPFVAEALPGLLAELQAADCQPRALSFGTQNLEEVFMRLTRRSLRD
ncbi:MAG: ABC transporter ATP-binding protein [Azoarcus sp.]|nr:ABC transporter ATP-binding protein [Azoarcus sp.]